MTRIKKTRKTGPVAARSVPKEDRKREPVETNKKPVKHKGLPPGSRFSGKANTNKAGPQSGSEATDPRHGSKKPIALIMPGARAAAPHKQMKHAETVPVADLTPAEELALLENDERLQDFLDALDEGAELHVEDQAWVDQQLARFQQLAEILGLDLEGDEDDVGGELL